MFRLLLLTLINIICFCYSFGQRGIDYSFPKPGPVYGPFPETIVDQKKSCNVFITITQYFPYCGGAYPTEQEMNNFSPLSNCNFILINLETKAESTIKTNSAGILILDLAPGNYAVKEMYKNCTYEEFLIKHPIISNQDMMNAGEECYKKWWSSYLCEFIITATGFIIEYEISLFDQCFTGNNPCISYLGPYPP